MADKRYEIHKNEINKGQEHIFSDNDFSGICFWDNIKAHSACFQMVCCDFLCV